MAKRRTQWGENWDSGVLVEHTWDNFDLVMIKVIWGHLVLHHLTLIITIAKLRVHAVYLQFFWKYDFYNAASGPFSAELFIPASCGSRDTSYFV